jgi:hypothetical protein
VQWPQQAAAISARAEAARLAAIEARKLPEPDLAAFDPPAKPTKGLKVQLAAIDDVGMVLINTPDGKWQVGPMAEWVSGEPGSATDAIDKLLKTGTNHLVFALHNKAFQFGPGRWSFQFALQGDGGSLWSNAGGQAGGAVGIRYWRPLTVTRSAAGWLTLQPTSEAQLGPLRDKMRSVHEWWIQNAGVETSAANALVAGLTTAMARDLAGGRGRSGGTACDSSCQIDNDALDRIERDRQQRDSQRQAEQEAAARAQWERLSTPNQLGW